MVPVVKYQHLILLQPFSVVLNVSKMVLLYFTVLSYICLMGQVPKFYLGDKVLSFNVTSYVVLKHRQIVVFYIESNMKTYRCNYIQCLKMWDLIQNQLTGWDLVNGREVFCFFLLLCHLAPLHMSRVLWCAFFFFDWCC